MAYLCNRGFISAFPEGTPPFMRNYFNDVLTVPVMFPILMAIQECLHLREGEAGVREIAAWTAIWSILFEAIFPAFTTSATSDLMDVLCYIGGAVIYAFLTPKPYWATNPKAR